MGCLTAGGIDTPLCANRFQAPGIERDKIWMLNKEEIATITSTVTGEVDVITMTGVTTAFKVDVHKNSVIYDEELVTSEDAAPYYTQKLSAKIIANDTATMTAIEDMVDVDLVFVVKLKSGKFKIIGEDSGVQLTLNTYSTGKVAGDAVGDMLELTGISNGKARFFFDTDEATSEATLDLLLV